MLATSNTPNPRPAFLESCRKSRLVIALASLVFLLSTTWSPANTTTQPASRPNFIIISADALSAGKTGFEGHAIIKTPHLDKLAAESVYFSRAYVAVPQTTGSRVSLLTGRFPHSTGVMNETDAVPTQAYSFTEDLARAGYACGLIGAWKVPVPPVPSPSSDTPTDTLADVPASAPAENAAPKIKLPKPGLGFDSYFALSFTADPSKAAHANMNGEQQPIEGYLPDWQTARALDFLRQARNKPFCLCLFYSLPDEALAYPPGMESLYPPKRLPGKVPQFIDSKNLPPRLGSCGPVMKYQSMTDKQYLEALSKYYAMVTRLDENIGRLLSGLDELNLRHNTVIVFTSAKGFPTGENTVWGTGPILWEPFIRCPLLVKMPNIKPGTSKNLVSLIDLAPTLLEVAGLSPSPLTQGRSLMPLLHGREVADWTNECFVEHDLLNGQTFGSRTLVSESFKLVDYLQEGEMADQFFDLKRDPQEKWNLVNEPSYSSLVKTLRLRLERWRKRTQDTATE